MVTMSPQVIWSCQSEHLKKAALTRAAKYSVSVSFPPCPRMTSVTAANTAQICDAHQVTELQPKEKAASWIKHYFSAVLTCLPLCERLSWTPSSAAPF